MNRETLLLVAAAALWCLFIVAVLIVRSAT